MNNQWNELVTKIDITAFSKARKEVSANLQHEITIPKTVVRSSLKNYFE